MGNIDNKRLQIVRFLAAEGADTEKKISALTIDDIVMFDKIKTEDIRLIRRLQQDIKSRNVIGFLTKGTDTGLNDIDNTKKEADEDDETDDGAGDGTGDERNSKPVGTGTTGADADSGNVFGSEGIY